MDEMNDSLRWRGRAYLPPPELDEPLEPWPLPPLTPDELQAHRALEESTEAERLATLEAADPSQKRPTRKPSWLDHVDFIDTE